jgi:hypothetical protein
MTPDVTPLIPLINTLDTSLQLGLDMGMGVDMDMYAEPSVSPCVAGVSYLQLHRERLCHLYRLAQFGLFHVRAPGPGQGPGPGPGPGVIFRGTSVPFLGVHVGQKSTLPRHCQSSYEGTAHMHARTHARTARCARTCTLSRLL